MQITKVELKNIKNHAEAEFAFQPGVVAICGPNGSGKTTILEAIAWVLFDHLDYKRDDFVKRGAKRGQAAVSFISNLDGREYVVTRDTGGGYNVYDPTTKIRLAEQKNQVVPWLQQHIGVEPGTDLAALFKTTIGVPQGSFTYDFTLAPSNRKSVFDQILKVEEYRNASENLRDTLRHIEARIVESDKKLAEAEGELKVYDETKREHDGVEQRMKMLDAELVSAHTERDRLSSQVERLAELQRKIETHRGAVERLRVKLELGMGSLATAREAAAQARSAAKIVEAAHAGYENYLAAVSRLAELEGQREVRDGLRKDIATIERALIEARSQAMRNRERLSEVANAREELSRLAGKVEEQNAIELIIARLREGRGELQSLKRSVEALDLDLDKLRRRYSNLSRQIEVSEAQHEKAGMADLLEQQRAGLDDEIAQKELALGNYKLKQEHLERLRKDQKRLSEELERTRNEVSMLEPLAETARRLADLESQHQKQTETLAHLRAEVARDHEMITALESGGVCPLLTEKCLNLEPGESLDSRFRSGLESRRSEIESLQAAMIKLAGDVKQSRAAAAEVARLEHLQAESPRLARELEIQLQQIAEIERETAGVKEADIKGLKAKRSDLEKALREARDAARILSQAEVLHGEMRELMNEGEAKRKAREDLALRVAELGDIESQMAETEARLQALGDPRSRAKALKEIIAHEDEWKLDAEKTESIVNEASEIFDKRNAELNSYGSLDFDLTSVIGIRAASERDYQAYIAYQKIAETARAREQEVESLSIEIEEINKNLAGVATELGELEREYDAEQHRRDQAELDRWRERATQLAAQLDHAREQFKRLHAQLARLNEVREKMRQQFAEKERSERLRETTDFIRDILQKAVPYITESYLFSISNEANQLFREITGRWDVALRWTKDYEITLEEEGRERPFLNLSGGEQMAAALSVRLALLKELSEVNLAFFDEPTTNMDEERRRNLAQQIGRIKDFQQLFVISHDDSFEGFTDQVVMLGN